MSNGQVHYLTIKMVEICCAKCGISFAMPSDVKQQYAASQTSFYCPRGHSQYYPGESEKEKYERQLDQVESELNFQKRKATQLAHQVRAQKAAKTKLKNRIKHGVCPCCKRTFQNIAKHIATKHPGYGK